MPEETPAVDETTQETTESDPQVEEPATETESTEEEAQPATDWEKRYTDLRPQHDRNQTRLNQFEQFYENLTNPKTQSEALRALGLELDGEDPEDDYTDPTDEIAQIKQYLTEREELEQSRELEDLLSQVIEQEMGKLPDGLSDKEKQVIERLARTMTDEDGVPDIAQAHKVLSEVDEVSRKRYMESKKAPGVGVGQAGTEKIDMADDDARAQHLANMIEAGESA